MPKLLKRDPACRLHKPSGQARVRIGGKEFWLGPYGSPESEREYDRIVGLWRANGRKLPADLVPGKRPAEAIPEARPPDVGAEVLSLGLVTVKELILAYWRHSQAYYVKDGEPTMEVESIRRAMKFVRDLFGELPAVRFGPLALEAVQKAMIEHGWCRTHINRQIHRVKRMVKWGASKEMFPASVYEAVRVVEELKKSRSAARENPEVVPVPDTDVEKTLAHLSPTVASMVQVQRLAGMRPQEVCGIRAADIETADPGCWIYRPDRHKGEHRDQDRVIFLGPRAQQILKPFMALDVAGCLFSPKRAEAERSAERRTGRVTPLWPSHCKRRRSSRPKKPPGDRYTRHSYRTAIQRACKRAGVPKWHPHQLRHTAGTQIRQRYGLEGAQAVLGHAELGSTQIYAAKNLDAAREIMKAIG